MSGYLFVANSTKPNEEKRKNREPVKLSTVNRPCLYAAKEHGLELFLGVNRDAPEELICEELPLTCYDSHTYRSITAFKDNRIAYKNICNVLKNNDIQVIHCNTPIGGMVGRLAGKKYKVPTIIYTAHGFHFYKGAPLFNRTVLKWAEKVMARWTDAIITMNREDYEAAKKFKLRRGGKAYLVHGVGIDLSLYETIEVNRDEKRAELGLLDTDVAFISMGDLIPRKNYAVAIEALAKAGNTNAHYFICGKGPLKEELEELASRLGVADRVHFLGFRTDVKELLVAADAFLFTTVQEGLPRSMMEAMASGLPCIVSKIRGNVDLMENGTGGYLCDAKDVDGFAEAIKTVTEDAELRQKMSEFNLKHIKEFDVSVVEKEIREIYNEVLGKTSKIKE